MAAKDKRRYCWCGPSKLSSWLQSDPDTTEGRQLSTVLDDLGLLQIVSGTLTRYLPTGRFSPSLLDLIITNTPHLVTKPAVLPPLFDHCPVICNVKLLQPREQHQTDISIPDYASANFEAMRADLWTQPLYECSEGARVRSQPSTQNSKLFPNQFQEFPNPLVQEKYIMNLFCMTVFSTTSTTRE